MKLPTILKKIMNPLLHENNMPTSTQPRVGKLQFFKPQVYRMRRLYPIFLHLAIKFIRESLFSSNQFSLNKLEKIIYPGGLLLLLRPL